MNKHLPPPLKMKVERGRLVPATQFDAERLDSYRVGSTVNVRFTADRMRPLERKYRAILDKVIKECQTPWTNAEAAHQAIKLACGIVNVGKTAGGQYMLWPRSLVALNDKEMEEYFNDAMVLIEKITGIDPETLKRETSHVSDDIEDIDPETGEILTNTNTGEAPPSASPVDDENLSPPVVSSSEPSDIAMLSGGSPNSNAADDAPASAHEGSATPPTSPVQAEPSNLFEPTFNIPAGELQHLKDFARKALDDAASKNDPPAKEASIERMRLNYLDAVESKDARQAIEAMGPAFDAVIKGKRTRAQAASYIAADLLGCAVVELEGRCG